MNKKFILLVAIIFLSACSKSGKDSTQTTPTADVTSAQIISLAKESLAVEKGISLDEIVFEKIEKVDFTDSCLDVVMDEVDCDTITTPGYKIEFSLDGKQYIYHSNMEGTMILLANFEDNGGDSGSPEIPLAINAAKEYLSNELSVKPTSIKLVSYEYRKWPDGCLGIVEEGKMCIQVITPGYSITFESEGQTFRLRTDQSGSLIKIDTTKPQPGVQDS